MIGRKSLAERIRRLGPIEHAEIFRILQRRSVPYTQNTNGIFADIANVPEEVVQELARFEAHCVRNDEMLRCAHQPPARAPEPPEPRAPEHPDQPGDGAHGAGAAETSSEARARKSAEKASFNVIKQRNDTSVRRSGTKFQAQRKKYTRPVPYKTAFPNTVRAE